MTNFYLDVLFFLIALILLGHGSCSLLLYVDESVAGNAKCEPILKFLSRDIYRRCLHGSKIPKSNYSVGKEYFPLDIFKSLYSVIFLLLNLLSYKELRYEFFI